MQEFLRNSVEWQKWGMNVATISAIGATILTVFQGWSFIKQGQAIWRAKSGDSVSVLTFGYLYYYFMSFAVYALSMKSLVMLINGMLFLSILPITFGLAKFKRYTTWERILYSLFGIMPVWMFFAPYKKPLLLVFLGGLVVALLLPVREIWREKARGVVDIRFIVVGMITNIFWFVFALTCADDVPLLIINPVAFVISGITLWLWVKYPNPIKKMEKKVIESYGRGCMWARLAIDHTIYEVAESHTEALRQLLISLHVRGFSGNLEDYEVRLGKIVDGVFVPWPP